MVMSEAEEEGCSAAMVITGEADEESKGGISIEESE